MKPLVWLTFRKRIPHVATPRPRLDYGTQITLFADTYAAVKPVYDVLRKDGYAVAYGREGDKAHRDSHPGENWDDCK